MSQRYARNDLRPIQERTCTEDNANYFNMEIDPTPKAENRISSCVRGATYGARPPEFRVAGTTVHGDWRSFSELTLNVRFGETRTIASVIGKGR